MSRIKLKAESFLTVLRLKLLRLLHIAEGKLPCTGGEEMKKLNYNNLNHVFSFELRWRRKEAYVPTK